MRRSWWRVSWPSWDRNRDHSPYNGRLTAARDRGEYNQLNGRRGARGYKRKWSALLTCCFSLEAADTEEDGRAADYRGRRGGGGRGCCSISRGPPLPDWL